MLALPALGLGDLLVVVPALRALARAFPGHRRILAAPAWLEPIARLIPGVDALAPTPGVDGPIESCPAPVDLAVNLHGRGPQSQRLLDPLGRGSGSATGRPAGTDPSGSIPERPARSTSADAGPGCSARTGSRPIRTTS